MCVSSGQRSTLVLSDSWCDTGRANIVGNTSHGYCHFFFPKHVYCGQSKSSTELERLPTPCDRLQMRQSGHEKNISLSVHLFSIAGSL